MSRSLSIPDELYDRLAAEASSEGLPGIEALLRRISDSFSERQRHKAVERVRKLSQELHRKYGEQPDSTPLIRSDRAEPRRPVAKFGSARGLIKIADDFDAPLEDFEAYGP